MQSMPYGGTPKLLQYENLSLSAGTNTLTIFTSIASQSVFARKIGFQYTGTVTGVIVSFAINQSGTNYFFQSFTPLVSTRWNLFQVDMWITPTMSIVAQIAAATLNNDFVANLMYDEMRSDR